MLHFESSPSILRLSGLFLLVFVICIAVLVVAQILLPFQLAGAGYLAAFAAAMKTGTLWGRTEPAPPSGKAWRVAALGAGGASVILLAVEMYRMAEQGIPIDLASEDGVILIGMGLAMFGVVTLLVRGGLAWGLRQARLKAPAA